MSQVFRRFLGLILLIATVGIATCQSMVKAETPTVVLVPTALDIR